MIGERFGNYTVLSLLGEGGMGAVYMAEHPEIGRKVAVKVLREELAGDEGLLSRFLNEARAANAIRHPNIIEILDGGRTAAGKPYMVMELLEGESLSARIGRMGRLPLRESLEFLYQAASALAAAHGKGIIHRDLKPDNLFVVTDPLDGQRLLIKVLDFGIAKLQTQPRGDSFRTRTGTLMGTPTYMSPEQCLGTRDVDLRSDIYAIGVIAFEMLVGRPPFVSAGFGELVNMHLNLPPPSMRTAVPDLPATVEAVVLRCLAKNPDDRFATMAELQAALKVAAGSLQLGARSSPNLDAPSPGRTVALSETQAGTLSQAFGGSGQRTTIAGAAGEASAPRRRGVMIGGLAGLVGLGALVVFFVLRGSGETGHARPVTTGLKTSEPASGQPALPPPPPPAEQGKRGLAERRAQGESADAGLADPVHALGSEPAKPSVQDPAVAAGNPTKKTSGATKDVSRRPHRPRHEREDEPAKL